MTQILQALAGRRSVRRRMALVVAHPDDETIAAGASLRLMPDLLLVHVTDGAPRELADARRSGFETAAAYAAARERELEAALAVAGVRPHRAGLEVPDKEAVDHVRSIAARLGELFAQAGIEAVLTHAYEGGHPDHDATACAVHMAARRLDLPVLEFAGYRAAPGGTAGGEIVVQRFLPGPAETHVMLDPEAADIKQAMYDCFVSQREILSMFGASIERFRPAPGYDFQEAPHAGALNYENWGWMTGAEWRARAGTLACAN